MIKNINIFLAHKDVIFQKHLKAHLLTVIMLFRTAWRERLELSLSRKSLLWLVWLTLTAAGIGNWLLARLSIHLAVALQPTLMPAYKPPGPYYNGYLLSYVVAIFCALAITGLIWLKRSAKWLPDGPPAWLATLKWPDPLLIAIIMTGLIIASPSWLSTAFFATALLTLLFLSLVRTNEDSTTISIGAGRFDIASNFLARLPLLISAPMVWTALVVLSLALGARAWYPVVIPNDYYEVEDALSIKKSWVNLSAPAYITMPRLEAIRCLIAPPMYLEPADLNLEKLAPLEISKGLPTILNNAIFSITSDGVVGPKYEDYFRNSIKEEPQQYSSLENYQPSYSANSSPKNSDIDAKASDNIIDNTFLLRRKLTDEEARALWDRDDRNNWTANERKYACLYLRHEISPDDMALLQKSLSYTAVWQAQAGRMFYHHSYIYVPARHLIAYGIKSPISYVYGLGNTMFHAMLLKIWGPSYTTYFNTFPIAQLTGLMAFGLLVFYVTSNGYAGLASFGAAFALLYLIGSSYHGNSAVIKLAPGFSPLRYLGLLVQAASIFWVFRGKAWRTLGIPIAMGFSFFWNREYAILGASGQILALLSPNLPISRLARSAVLAISLLSVGTMVVGRAGSSPDSIETTQISFFGIAVPVPDGEDFTKFALWVVAATLILIWAARRFSASERDARYCLLPIMALVGIKYLFNAASPHLVYFLLFMLPLILCFIKWNNIDQFNTLRNSQYRRLRDIGITFILCICTGSAFTFTVECIDFNNIYNSPYKSAIWSDLGERFRTPLPEEPIFERIAAVRTHSGPSDKLLLLSPFDHLIASYVNPERYCGNFEILTNLVTEDNVSTVLKCAHNSSDVLIVYDIAMETPCQEGVLSGYTDAVDCLNKKKVKDTAQAIMLALKPDTDLIATDGDLQFYRMKPEKLAQTIKK